MSTRFWLLCLLGSILLDSINACVPLDNGPFLATRPTLQFEFDEATATGAFSSSSPYYSELRIAGIYGDDFNLTVYSDNSIIEISEYFQFVRQDGKNYMTLVKPIDRDGNTASPEDDIAFLSFTLTCSSITLNITYDARVLINDVNDNRPEFVDGNTTHQISVGEATPVGTVVYHAIATDKDSNLEANLTYTLESAVDRFAVDSVTGDVTVTQDLDYESVTSTNPVILVISVKDGGPKVFWTASTTVQVSITDSDDQGPAYDYPGCFKYAGVCAWPKYTTGRQLKKNTAVQVFPVPNVASSTVKMAAYDLDVGISSQIQFSIASTIPSGQESNFRVDTAKEGNRYVATVTPVVDIEVNEGFIIFLKAEENTTNKRHSIAMILFTGNATTVTPVKACEPLDAGHYLGTTPTLILSVEEATQEDIQAASVSGSMKYYSELRISGDFGAREFNLSVAYDVIDPFYYFEVVTEKGANYMRLIQAVDRDGSNDGSHDPISYIPFTLTCTPANSSQGPVVFDVRVFITDVNDNTPSFINVIPTSLRIPETTVPGTKLYTVSAVDRDANEDRNLTFSLMNVTDQFSINVLTGDVTLEKSLDYESMGQQKYFNITIQVEDAGPGMKQTATMMLPIYVIDADDQGPAFVYTGCFTHSTVCVWPQYTTGLELKRNQAITVYPVPNKVKGQVTINAYDLDTDIGNEINFSIASTIPPGQETNFKVETIKGQGSEYIANIVSLVDLQLSEGFEIFLKAEEKSENRRHAIAMVYFTSTPATTPTAEQQQGSSSSTKDSGYSDLEIALIVVVSILATFLVSLILGVVIFTCLKRRSSKEESSFSTTM